jgi:IS30 family transposase
MARRSKRLLTDTERAELWARWRRGDTLSDISRVLAMAPGSVFTFLSRRGGIAPPARRRADSRLSLSEREEISRGIASDASIRSMARLLQRLPSTISREITRNGGRARYRAAKADRRAWWRAKRPRPCKLSQDRRLRNLVAHKLQRNWSPEQISGWLKRKFPGNELAYVSHETIYRSLFIQARGVLKKELVAHLRSRRKMRRARQWSTAGQTRGQIGEAISIRERPAEVEDRAIPGHWEGDLITGSKNSHIATLVERHSRYTMLVRLKGKDTNSVIAALTKQVLRLPAELRRTLTWDRGTEMARHQAFTIATDMKVYFCDPQSPWQRGTNENTNRLLRQYFPKGTDLSVYSQAYLNRIATELNQRPRKTLAFRTPADKLNMVLR